MSQVVHVVHCIDTEGPLTESLADTFVRLKAIYGIELPATPNVLRRLQRAEIPLDGREAAVARTFAPELLAYNRSWDMIDAMLGETLSVEYRNRLLDSFGGGWIYNWHCLDHVGFTENPRHRDIGYHNVFDHYRSILERTGSTQDGIHFHHHPVAFSGVAIHQASAYFSNGGEIYRILARRILDRQWFPAVFRPGFHTTRPDSHWFMEQHIPFDYANQSGSAPDPGQRDLADGRFGDWRRAPQDWTPYHPDHDDYQRPGRCRRWIARCLNIGTRHGLLTQAAVDQAFAQAAAGQPTVLAFTCHDFRDMRPPIDGVRTMLHDAAARHPGVPFRFCEAREAIRRAFSMPDTPAPQMTLAVDGGRLVVRTNRPLFGPQPFFALRTRCGRYLTDNLDVAVPGEAWHYTFDNQTVPADALASVGVGACDAQAQATVTTLDMRTGVSASATH